ncbi:MAG: hypothetical protein NW237_01035 [Cyanobacteriota bacterium]|nr:hypothetical protein [Cyanobacteriota bacterium]
MKDPGAVFRESTIGYLVTWGILQFICFRLLPQLKIFEAFDFQEILVPSILLGMFGSMIAGLASSVVAASKTTANPQRQKQGRLVGWVLGTIGFLGVSFPLLLGGWIFYQSVRQSLE